MPTQVQFRRGTATQNGSFTGAEGEISYDTTNNTLRVHDGSTAGGFRLALYSELAGITDTDDITEGSTNLWYTDARVGTFLSSVNQDIVPDADNTRSLGSSSKQWADVYVGPGSLYVNGQQVVSDNSGTITISADSNQNVSVQTSGTGDIEFDPTGTGVIQVKGTLQITDGENITNSAGNDITFANNIKVNQITTYSSDTNLVLSGNGTGNVTVNDDMTVTGSLTVSGTTTTVNSETVNIADNTLVLNSNFTSGSPTEDAGLSISRGGSTSVTLLWDETNDKWTIGSETFVAGTVEANLTGNVTGDLTGTASNATTAVTLTGLTSTITELNYVDGVTSNIQTQLDDKAALASPALTGTPTAPTATTGTDTTQIATTAFVQAAIAELEARLYAADAS